MNRKASGSYVVERTEYELNTIQVRVTAYYHNKHIRVSKIICREHGQKVLCAGWEDKLVSPDDDKMHAP